MEAEDNISPASSVFTLTVNEELQGHRLDYAVSRELGLSRNFSQRLIKEGRVLSSSQRRVKPSIKIELGEQFVVDVPPPEKLDLEPEDVPFTVVYHDKDIIVVDKPAGLVVHPAPGHWRGTLVHGLLYRFPDMGSMNGVERPGIVHRLDATTSGLMVVARNGLAQERLWSDFKERRVDKIYLALCHGRPPKDPSTIRLPIARDPNSRTRMAVVEGGRDAVTDIEVIWHRGGYSFVKCTLHTGRTHQIRVHMRAIGCPLVGDTLYAPKLASPFDPPRVFLHAWRLSFKHPRTGATMAFTSYIHDELKAVVRGIVHSSD